MLFCTPMLLGRKAKPFNDPEWIFELKFAGFPALAVVEYGSCTLFSQRAQVCIVRGSRNENRQRPDAAFLGAGWRDCLH